jgi:hypothetical protein
MGMYIKVLAFAALLVSSLSLIGCIRFPTSTCGAMPPEQCQDAKRSFSGWIARSCREGELIDSAARKLQASELDFQRAARTACQDVASGKDVDDLFYNFIADMTCLEVEQKVWDTNMLEDIFVISFGWATSMDEVVDEMKEERSFVCNEFRSGRITGRDAMSKEAAIWREFHRTGQSTIWDDMWAFLTWNAKILVGIISVIATVLGIVLSVKKILSR